MVPALPPALEATVSRWDGLSRWERAELGRELRRLGLSYGEIAQLVPVPKSTLAGWCRGIVLSPRMTAEIRARTAPAPGVPRDTQRRRRLEVHSIRRSARLEARTLVSDPLWVAGTALYWGEGEKSHRRLSMTNTDPDILRLFLAWVDQTLIPAPDVSLSLHIHSINDLAVAEQFWARALDRPDAHFTKPFVKKTGARKPKNIHPHGLCRVVIRRSSDAFERTTAWIDELPGLLGTNLSAASALLTSRPGR